MKRTVPVYHVYTKFVYFGSYNCYSGWIDNAVTSNTLVAVNTDTGNKM